MTCERCRGETAATIMSVFNTENVCLGCKRAEEAHPDYERAERLENAAVRRGDFNYRGVGLPPELRVAARA